MVGKKWWEKMVEKMLVKNGGKQWWEKNGGKKWWEKW